MSAGKMLHTGNFFAQTDFKKIIGNIAYY